MGVVGDVGGEGVSAVAVEELVAEVFWVTGLAVFYWYCCGEGVEKGDEVWCSPTVDACRAGAHMGLCLF